MKYTLLVTQECNLACGYCYINKRDAKMSDDTAEKVINFIFSNTPESEKINIGFFGGEPLLEFGLVKDITHRIEHHPRYKDYQVELSLVTNGTILTEEIAEFLNKHNIGYFLSCDGSPKTQDISRRFKTGEGSSNIVENNMKRANEVFPVVMVNAVYYPGNIEDLAGTVEYFSSMGIRRIYLNPDFSAKWTREDVERLWGVYKRVAEVYIDSYIKGKPLFVSLLDGKIAVILRGGYQPEERCHMGRKEIAFSPDGNIFPCERLVGGGSMGNKHCIGSVYTGIYPEKMLCNMASGESINQECLSCGLREYCMNWCGCSNYQSAGYYNRVGPFICASERASIQVAFDTIKTLERELGPVFFEHFSGRPAVNSAM